MRRPTIRRFTHQETEKKVFHILQGIYPQGIRPPVDIDRIVEQHDLVDDIVPIPRLEDKYHVAATLFYKPNGRFDIIVDQDTLDSQRGRCSFSIAHEFGHIVLHPDIWRECRTIDDVIEMNESVKGAYGTVERDANYFAGAILMPATHLPAAVKAFYDRYVQTYRCFDRETVVDRICRELARRYKVSFRQMEIRLRELGLQRRIEACLRSQSLYMP